MNKAEYLYNGVGNRTSLMDRRGAQTFGYDNLDRLTTASHPLLVTPQAFSYDAVGNRTTAGDVTNAGNQLTSDAMHTYQYDDNGNLTRKTLLATGNYTQYTYDAENRLTKVEDFIAGNPTAAFTSTVPSACPARVAGVIRGQIFAESPLSCPVRADSEGFSGDARPHSLTNRVSASHREGSSARF